LRWNTRPPHYSHLLSSFRVLLARLAIKESRFVVGGLHHPLRYLTRVILLKASHDTRSRRAQGSSSFRRAVPEGAGCCSTSLAPAARTATAAQPVAAPPQGRSIAWRIGAFAAPIAAPLLRGSLAQRDQPATVSRLASASNLVRLVRIGSALMSSITRSLSGTCEQIRAGATG